MALFVMKILLVFACIQHITTIDGQFAQL